MNQCWPEGALRAYLDGELPPQDMQAVAAHLGKCAACDFAFGQIENRLVELFRSDNPNFDTQRFREACNK